MSIYTEFRQDIKVLNKEEIMVIYKFLLHEERHWWCAMMECQVNYDPIVSGVLKLQDILMEQYKIDSQEKHEMTLKVFADEDNARHKYNWDFSESKYETYIENKAFEISEVLNNLYGKWVEKHWVIAENLPGTQAA